MIRILATPREVMDAVDLLRRFAGAHESSEDALTSLASNDKCVLTLLTKGPPRIVKQFHFESWQRHGRVPSSAAIILDILEHVERWQMQGEGTTVVVQCLDGCQESGLYCVSAAICDQLKLEKELDVFSAVRNVRASRVEFIVDSEQYAFCYEVALACVDSLHIYCSVE
ncbi:receptor-type tyrosine-protein phosphatase alpha-like [Haemaphysalis longicornis]